MKKEPRKPLEVEFTPKNPKNPNTPPGQDKKPRDKIKNFPPSILKFLLKNSKMIGLLLTLGYAGFWTFGPKKVEKVVPTVQEGAVQNPTVEDPKLKQDLAPVLAYAKNQVQSDSQETVEETIVRLKDSDSNIKLFINRIKSHNQNKEYSKVYDFNGDKLESTLKEIIKEYTEAK
jgi:hypothetical protein